MTNRANTPDLNKVVEAVQLWARSFGFRVENPEKYFSRNGELRGVRFAKEAATGQFAFMARTLTVEAALLMPEPPKSLEQSAASLRGISVHVWYDHHNRGHNGYETILYPQFDFYGEVILHNASAGDAYRSALANAEPETEA